MIRNLRLWVAAIASSMAIALPASATTYSVDYTDLWYNPAESGWGVNLIQQGQTIFATLFVYGADNTPRWYVASDLEPATTGSQDTFTGTLYQTNGPYFAAASFNPSSVTNAPVGTMTFTFTGVATGTLQYAVNGANVIKSIQRQTWRTDSLAGNYLGGLTAIGSNCGSGVANGAVLAFNELTAQQSGSQVTFKVVFTASNGQASQCTFTGTYAQQGRLGDVTGNWGCSVGGASTNQGTFTISALQNATTGFSGKFTGTDQFCTYNGQFGGVRDVL